MILLASYFFPGEATGTQVLYVSAQRPQLIYGERYNEKLQVDFLNFWEGDNNGTLAGTLPGIQVTSRIWRRGVRHIIKLQRSQSGPEF